MPHDVHSGQQFWDRFARYDPLWAILSDPSKRGRRWDLRTFLETGRREVSLLMYQLRALGLDVHREAALDFGCGIGRLTQPLAAHFDRVIGVDISPEMIRLADDLNRHPGRVRYVCNVRDDLAILPTGDIAFAYSNIVLQHVEPALALQYVKELLRVVAPGGVLVFQMPSHLRRPEEQPPEPTAMPDEAYRASIRVERDLPLEVLPGAELTLAASVVNISGCRWAQREIGAIRFGNHWLDATGRTMLVQDDGRAPLPEVVEPGQTCPVVITVTAPREAGAYQLEYDLVHEGISWFADKGSQTWRGLLVVAGDGGLLPADGGDDAWEAGATRWLPDVSVDEPPGALPMHGVHRDILVAAVEANGGRLVHLEPDERCGREWVGYRYFVKKD